MSQSALRIAAAARPAVPSPGRIEFGRPARWLGWLAVAIVVVLVCPASGRADGAHIAFRATNGPYSLTLFTAPEPLVNGPADLSLLVQDVSSGAVLDNATATATLTRPDAETIRLTLTHALASNKLLLAAAPTLPAPGNYTLVLHIERPGSPTASFKTVLPVQEDHRRQTTLWFALVLPLAAILLFLVNQKAKFARRPALQ